MFVKLGLFVSIVVWLAACSEGEANNEAGSPLAGQPRYVLGSVVIEPDDNRTTYVQAITSLEDGPFTNRNAIELPGNGTLLARGRQFYVGHTEEPTWSRYSVGDDGKLEKTGEMSLMNTGAASIDYGNVIIDDETAVSVFSEPAVAVVWDPSTMEIRGEIPLPFLERDGYALEVWTTVTHDGLVYIPGRWADWDGERIYPGVSLTILDPKEMKILGTAEDDRCASGGRPVFDEAGYAYVMGDGRNYSIQAFANARGEADTAPDNCLLRIAPGQTDFEADYYYTIPSLTDGKQSITELDTAVQGSGVAFAKMFYPEKLPEGVEPFGFDFWEVPAHKLWKIKLADPPTAEEVDDIPFAAIGFDSHAIGGRLYSGESPDGQDSEIYEIDPETNHAEKVFDMKGYFYGLYEIEP